MLKYILISVAALFLFIFLILFVIPRITTAKYKGATIRIFNKTFTGLWTSYVGKIVSERKQVNIIQYPFVNSLFLCKPSNKKDAKEKYYTYSRSKGRLFYVEKVNPGLEKTNTMEQSAFHEIMIKPFDKLVLNYVFRNFS